MMRSAAPTPSTIALVAGRKSSGKTRVVKRGLARVARWVVWDVRGEYADPLTGVAGARLWTDLRDFFAHLRAGGSIAREVFACPSAQFDVWCKWVARTGSLVVVIEELGRHCQGGRVRASLLDLVERSRHHAIDLIATTSRVARVPIDLRVQVDELLLARHVEPTDCAYLASWLGQSASARAQTLKPGTFVRIHP